MNLLEKHFAIATEAADGINKLRLLIYSLGMQGKLSEQKSTDLSAAELLQLIIKEKTIYIKENSIRTNKSSSIEFSKSQFPIPNSWLWVTLDDITNFITDYQSNGSFAGLRKNVISYRTPNFAVQVRLTDLRNNLNNSDNFLYTDKHGYDFLIKSKLEGGEILVANVGAGVGTTLIMPTVDFKATLAPNMFKVILSSKISKSYFLYFTKSKFYQTYFIDNIKSTAQPKINKTEYKSIYFPLPPLEEQKRIVERIEQLMSLCDKLEQQRDSKNNLLSRLNSSSINKLISAADSNSLNYAWRFIQNQFELIFADKRNVLDLKEVILSLAMRGKLATNNSNDIPSSKLLVEIEAERKLLIKQKLISKPKDLPLIMESEIKYALPLGWEWVRLNEYGIWKSGSTPSRTNHSFYGGDIPWVKSGEVKQGRIKEASERITEIAIQKCSLHRNPIGSVLIAMYGANIGEVGVLEIEAATNQAVCACKTYSLINNEFLYYLLLSLKSNFISQGAGAAQPNISREKIINTVVPLPPLNEQERIVNKIDSLFQIADMLESSIEESSKKQTQILDSVLANI